MDLCPLSDRMVIVLFQWDPGRSHGAGRKIARAISDGNVLHVIIIPRVTVTVYQIYLLIFKYIYNIPG